MNVPENPSKLPKRLDLQGIRGIAIISVLGFHFYPSLFPNGYLGVDQFFVLSGFLMCMLLKRSETLSPFSLITLFYSKRFKRILPLYLLIIALSMIFLYSLFPDTAIENNQNSATKALLFVSNRPKTDQENYFQMLAIGVDIFTHTWSLSVEIQFYFLVPIIYILGSLFSLNLQYFYYTFIGLFLNITSIMGKFSISNNDNCYGEPPVYLSLKSVLFTATLSFIFHTISSPNVSFNSVFARIWQFDIGMIVFLFSTQKIQLRKVYNTLKKDEKSLENLISDEEKEEKQFEKLYEVKDNTKEKTPKGSLVSSGRMSKYFLLFSMMYFVTNPSSIPALLIRVYFTAATGLLMCASVNDKILSNKVLTYIGDISYPLYLIHWPIYAYWKLTMNNNQAVLPFCLIGSVVLAILVYETYEKWYLKLSSTILGCIVVLLFIFNVVLINKDNIQEKFESKVRNFSRLDGITSNMTIDDAEKLNYQWSVQDKKNIRSSTCKYENLKGPWGWCNHTGLDPKGKYKIMLLGNSWTANHANMFYQECHEKANNILQGSAYGCEPLYPTSMSTMCKANLTDFVKRMEAYKPDYAFIFTRFMSLGDSFPKNVTKMKNDPIYKIMLSQLKKFLGNIKKKLYILDAIPRVHYDQVSRIANYVRKNMSFVEIDNKLTNIKKYEMARKRYAKLFEDCGDKCIRIDYTSKFYQNTTKTFRFFDSRGFSYMTTANHMSPHGLEYVRHIYTDICRKI